MQWTLIVLIMQLCNDDDVARASDLIRSDATKQSCEAFAFASKVVIRTNERAPKLPIQSVGRSVGRSQAKSGAFEQTQLSLPSSSNSLLARPPLVLYDPLRFHPASERASRPAFVVALMKKNSNQPAGRWLRPIQLAAAAAGTQMRRPTATLNSLSKLPPPPPPPPILTDPIGSDRAREVPKTALQMASECACDTLIGLFQSGAAA